MTNLQKNTIKNFERMYRSGITPWTSHPPEPALDIFLETLKKRIPKAKMLDIGCGDGWITIKAAREGFRVWGIDGSKTAIKQAKQKAVRENVEENTNIEVGNALELPFENNFFDAMVDRGLLHHILPENRRSYLENINRVLKKESLIYLAVFSMKNPESIGQRFTKEKVDKLFGEDYEIVYFDEDPDHTPAPAHLLHFILKKQ
jgi:ubiquinone/menaquinone biosynthesis C-methylase UbiE